MKVLVLVKSTHPYWNEVELGVKAAAKKYNLEATFSASPKEDSAEQTSIIEDFISKGGKGLAFAVSNPEALVSLIKKIKDKSIPCIALDTDAPQTGRDLYIGTNNYLAGKMAGDTLASLLLGKGEVAIGTGSLSAPNSKERIQGFKDSLSRFPKIKIVTTLCDDESANKAFSLAQSALLNYENLSGFYGVFNSNGPAAAKAVKSTNKVGKIKIVCFDTSPETIKFIKEGVINATIGQRPYTIGYRSVEFLYKMVTSGIDEVLKGVPPSRRIDTGVDVVTLESLNSYRDFLKKLGIPLSF